jgi:hypothetical protein
LLHVLLCWWQRCLPLLLHWLRLYAALLPLHSSLLLLLLQRTGLWW